MIHHTAYPTAYPQVLWAQGSVRVMRLGNHLKLPTLALSLGSEPLHLWGSHLLALNFGPWGPGKAPIGVSVHVWLLN